MSTKNYNVELMQPDEINALKAVAAEFLGRLTNLDNEIELLNNDRKELCEEFKNKLDLKTLKAALRVAKIQQGVAHRDTYDLFMEVLDSAAA